MLLYRCFFPCFLQIKSEKTSHQISGILEFGRQTSLQFESIWEMWLTYDDIKATPTPTVVMVFCGVGQGSLLFCQAGRTRPPSILNLIPPSLCLWEMMSLALAMIYECLKASLLQSVRQPWVAAGRSCKKWLSCCLLEPHNWSQRGWALGCEGLWALGDISMTACWSIWHCLFYHLVKSLWLLGDNRERVGWVGGSCVLCRASK